MNATPRAVRHLRAWALAAAILSTSAAAAADDPLSQVRKSRRDLMTAAVSAPPAPQAAPSGLDAAIERLRAIQLKPRQEEAQPAVFSSILPQAAPEAQSPASPARTKPPAKSASPAHKTTDATLEELKNLPPEQILDPLALADALYLTGRTDAAFIFYERAMQGQPTDDAKAWMLFQMANCLRPTDPVAATALYRRVAAEHPKSAWAGVAAVQERLIQSYQMIPPPAPATPAKPAAGAAGAAAGAAGTPAGAAGTAAGAGKTATGS
jgi:tetratricopeptide (TPR) repeat protein